MFIFSYEVWKAMHMNEVITLLTSVSGHGLVKSFSGTDLNQQPFSIGKLFQADRSKASDPKRLLTQLPTLVCTATQIATFKAGSKRTTTHRHLFLPKDYSGSPTP